MNLVEKLLKVNPEDLNKVPEKKIEIKRLSDMFGEPFFVTCKALPGERFVELTASASGKNGKVDYSKMYLANALIALEGIVDPDLKDKDLQKHFGCSTPKDLAEKLFNGGELTKIATAVTELSGYGEDSDDEIKN